jgi:hypothetical protein
MVRNWLWVLLETLKLYIRKFIKEELFRSRTMSRSRRGLFINISRTHPPTIYTFSASKLKRGVKTG